MRRIDRPRGWGAVPDHARGPTRDRTNAAPDPRGLVRAVHPRCSPLKHIARDYVSIQRAPEPHEEVAFLVGAPVFSLRFDPTKGHDARPPVGPNRGSHVGDDEGELRCDIADKRLEHAHVARASVHEGEST